MFKSVEMALTPRQQLALGGGVTVVIALIVKVTLVQFRTEVRAGGSGTTVERVQREGRAAEGAVVELARKDLSCEDVRATTTTEGIVAIGCDKRARYSRAGESFRHAPIESFLPDAGADGCRTLWTFVEDGGAKPDATAEATLAAIAASKRAARLRVPIEATGMRGFAKLRWGDYVETYVDGGAPLAVETLPVPCADAGSATPLTVRDCTVPLAAVTEIAECL